MNELGKRILINRLRTEAEKLELSKTLINSVIKSSRISFSLPKKKQLSRLLDSPNSSKKFSAIKQINKVEKLRRKLSEELVYFPEGDDTFETIANGLKAISEKLKEIRELPDTKFPVKVVENKTRKTIEKHLYPVEDGNTLIKKKRQDAVVIKEAPKEQPEISIVSIPVKKEKITLWSSAYYTKLNKKQIKKEIKKGRMSEDIFVGNYNYVIKEKIEEELTEFPRKPLLQHHLTKEKFQEVWNSIK